MMAHRTGGYQPPSIDEPVPHAFPFSRKSRARVRVRVRVRVRLASSRVRAKMTSCAFVSSRVHRRSTGVGEKISVRV
jgi:TPP-dependent indolepyruvate ferredoxin oxidoreductase alpha subunit